MSDKSPTSTVDPSISQKSIILIVIFTFLIIIFQIAVLVITIPSQDTPDGCENDKFNFSRKKEFCTTAYGQCTTSLTACQFKTSNCVYGWERNYWSLRDLGYGGYCVNEQKAIYNQGSYFFKLWPYATVLSLTALVTLWMKVWKICQDYHAEKDNLEKMNKQAEKKEV